MKEQAVSTNNEVLKDVKVVNNVVAKSGIDELSEIFAPVSNQVKLKSCMSLEE